MALPPGGNIRWTLQAERSGPDNQAATPGAGCPAHAMRASRTLSSSCALLATSAARISCSLDSSRIRSAISVAAWRALAIRATKRLRWLRICHSNTQITVWCDVQPGTCVSDMQPNKQLPARTGAKLLAQPSVPGHPSQPTKTHQVKQLFKLAGAALLLSHHGPQLLLLLRAKLGC